MFWIATSWLVALVAAAIFAPVLPLSDPTEIGVSGPCEGPSFSAFFGTDALGRDVFARTIHGAKVSLTVGGVAIVLGIIAKELLPCVLVPMSALLLLGLAVVIVAEGSLAFLGLSVSGDDAISWGKIIVDGAGIRDLEKSPHVALFPIATMFVTVLALNYLGDRIRQRFDVKELAF